MLGVDVDMVRIRLFILKGNVVPIVMINAAEHLKVLPSEKIADFLKWVARSNTNQESYTEDEMVRLSEKFGFKSVDELVGAKRFASLVFYYGATVSRTDVESDLKLLNFEKQHIALILDNLDGIWKESEDYLVRIRDETIPILSSLRWRVDVRHASSDYLKKPEVVALLRIGTNDKDKSYCIHFELDEDKLSWLETVIGKVKREMLKAKEIMVA
jgi:hypothetical protein